ncbi:MAG: tRNA (adenosine(37)-N6)-threonylcarbamoyltransferase complex ATPase subunit type 1 TsaE [Nitrosomonadales bacterium]
MNKSLIYAKCEEDTVNFAKLVAQYIKPGDIIFLDGDLGVGKTTLVRSILNEMGLKERVKSPTYNIVEHYSFNKTSVNHFDLYRFKSDDEWSFAGFDEYIKSNSISFIEWPKKIAKLGLKPNISINISYGIENGERKFEFVINE